MSNDLTFVSLILGFFCIIYIYNEDEKMSELITKRLVSSIVKKKIKN